MIDVDAILDELVARLAPAVAAELRRDAPPQDEEWRLLSLKETCARLGRSERQVRGWVSSGELPHVRLDGGDLRFDLDDVRAFARARVVSAAALEALTERWQGGRNRAAGAASRGAHRAGDRRVAGG